MLQYSLWITSNWFFKQKLCKIEKYTPFSCFLGARYWNGCKSIISDLQGLKFSPVVSLWILFPIPQGRTILDSLINSYARSPMMSWLWTGSVEWSFIGCHVSPFQNSSLNLLQIKLKFVLFQTLLIEFNYDAWNKIYDDFP